MIETGKIITGDCVEVMKTLPEGCVDLIVTSPPYGVGIAYQRYLWKGLYLAVHVLPALQTYINENGKNVGNGFMIFNTNRVGYHIKLFKDKFFIEPSVGIAGRPYHSEMPNGFKEKDDKWPKWTPEPGLHIGYNF
jgi:hypothetical protein